MKVNLTVETVCEFLGMASLDRDLGSTEDIPVLMILRGMVKQFPFQMQNKRTSEDFL